MYLKKIRVKLKVQYMKDVFRPFPRLVIKLKYFVGSHTREACMQINNIRKKKKCRIRKTDE